MAVRILIACLLVAALAAGNLALAVPAFAQDEGMDDLARDSVGVPLAPKEAAGAWTLESQGRSICRVTLSDHLIGPKLYDLAIPADCGQLLPSGVAGWKSVVGGMVMVDASGRVLVDFNRWSPELLVTARASASLDLALRRGT
jgi:hypothetical protein